MEDRLAELWKKLTSGNYNNATQFAYEIGFLSDIDYTLKKLKMKRTMVKQENVEEIEVCDIEPLMKKIIKKEKEITKAENILKDHMKQKKLKKRKER